MSYGKNYNIFNDLHELKQMIGSLKSYLRRDELYGSVGGGIFTGGGAPNLTVGVIQMRLRRLEALKDQLNERDQKRLAGLREEHDAIYDAQTKEYQAKIEHEANSRIDAMSRFFEECNEDPKGCARIYNPEAFRRTVVEELRTTMDDVGFASAELDAKVNATDKRLRRYVAETEFQWDDMLREVYPKSQYWWLWMSPVS